MRPVDKPSKKETTRTSEKTTRRRGPAPPPPGLVSRFPLLTKRKSKWSSTPSSLTRGRCTHPSRRTGFHAPRPPPPRCSPHPSRLRVPGSARGGGARGAHARAYGAPATRSRCTCRPAGKRRCAYFFFFLPIPPPLPRSPSLPLSASTPTLRTIHAQSGTR